MAHSTVIATGYLTYLKNAYFQLDHGTQERFWDYVKGPFDEERPLTLSEKIAFFDRAVERDSARVRHFLQPVIDQHVRVFEESVDRDRKERRNEMYEMYQNLGTSRSRSRAPSPDNWYREANDEAENPPFRSFFSVFKERRERERSLGRRCDQTRDDEREHGRSRVEGNKIDDGFQRGRSTVRTEKGSKDRLRSKSRGPPRQVKGCYERIWVNGEAVKYVIGKRGTVIAKLEHNYACRLNFDKPNAKGNGDTELEISSQLNDPRDVERVIAQVRILEAKACQMHMHASPDFTFEAEENHPSGGDEGEEAGNVTSTGDEMGEDKQ